MKQGLGDTIASLTKKLGISECGECSRRREKLNKWFPYLGEEGRAGKMAAAIGDHSKQRRRWALTDQVGVGESVEVRVSEGVVLFSENWDDFSTGTECVDDIPSG